MVRRDRWEFAYSIEDVRAAAERKAVYHRERERWWQQQLQEAEESLRVLGVEIRGEPVTGGARRVAVIDHSRQRRVDECFAKVQQHQKQAEQYEGWSTVLANQRPAPLLLLVLDMEDVLYFGLVPEPGGAQA